MAPPHSIDRNRFDGLGLDLDGVLTSTATIHSVEVVGGGPADMKLGGNDGG